MDQLERLGLLVQAASDKPKVLERMTSPEDLQDILLYACFRAQQATDSVHLKQVRVADDPVFIDVE